MQIRPQEPFPILYQISDPADSNTYYLRAVMRNSVTGAIIKIAGLNYVNLTRDSGNSRRFAKTIEAPNDPAGFGIHIDITTSVYTDSGYTVKSTVYQENIDKYLVQERWSVSWGGGGGWGDWDKKLKGAVDYEKIGDMVVNRMGKIPTKAATPADLSPIFESHDELKDLIKASKNKDINLRDFSDEIIQRFSRELRQAISNIKKPDFGPLLKAIEKLNIPDIPEYPDLKPHFTELKNQIDALKPLLTSTKYEGLMDDLAKKMTGRTIAEEDPSDKRVKHLLS